MPAPFPPCPHCGVALHGMGTYCWTCNAPVYPPQDRPLPAAAVPDTRSEEEIEAAIVLALRTLGWHVVKLSQPQRALCTPGTSDLLVMGQGIIAFAEVKRPGSKGRRAGTQSAEQIEFERHVRANGGLYLLWTSEADAIEFARAVMSPQGDLPEPGNRGGNPVSEARPPAAILAPGPGRVP